MIDQYKKGQVDLFNRLWDIVDKTESPLFDEENNFLLKMVALLKEMNKIRGEFEAKNTKKGGDK